MWEHQKERFSEKKWMNTHHLPCFFLHFMLCLQTLSWAAGRGGSCASKPPDAEQRKVGRPVHRHVHKPSCIPCIFMQNVHHCINAVWNVIM